ncbi:glutamate ionotropic receptor kainate type subunit 4 [Phyllostomus discolor]|uniref:Glutamate ionotropic receptor kainate type subunit 4 n=1 Tax=Phyllostomus discolor TaxID=89673 RepID=A0A834DFH9_9CHIR|nr:glutamate ionotropic receptor kainate type subunit 4 [Phyllostomus discolor]
MINSIFSSLTTSFAARRRYGCCSLLTLCRKDAGSNMRFMEIFLSAYYVPACARNWKRRRDIPTCSPLSWCSPPRELLFLRIS